MPIRCSSSGSAAFSAWPKPGTIHRSAAAGIGRVGERVRVVEREVRVLVAVHDQQRCRREGRDGGHGGERHGVPVAGVDAGAQSVPAHEPSHRTLDHPVQPPHRRGPAVVPAGGCADGDDGVGVCSGLLDCVRRRERGLGRRGSPDRATVRPSCASVYAGSPAPAVRGRYSAPCRTTTEPPMEKPTVATRSWPAERAQRTTAARSSTSRSPTVEWPPEPPWPRKEKVITAPYCANTCAARRSAGRSTDPLKPWASTIAPGAGRAVRLAATARVRLVRRLDPHPVRGVQGRPPADGAARRVPAHSRCPSWPGSERTHTPLLHPCPVFCSE